MNWIDNAIRSFSNAIPCGYARGGAPHSEPTSLAAIAMMARDPKRYEQPIHRARQWLAQQQLPNGSVQLNSNSTEIAWTTPIALLVESSAKKLWLHDNATLSGDGFMSQAAILPNQVDTQRAVNWLTAVHGNTMARDSKVGHDVELTGWSWIIGTHTWLEPTCMAVLALKSQGLWDHLRVREGVTVIRDRLLPHGGCNYGNTIVLGQELLPHIQPTGLALMALAGEEDTNGLIAKSIKWLQTAIDGESAAASLSYALLGLLAHNAVPHDAAKWFKQSYDRVVKQGNSPHRLALLAWAASQVEQGKKSPWPGMSATLQPVEI